jgi:hypothetical protein
MNYVTVIVKVRYAQRVQEVVIHAGNYKHIYFKVHVVTSKTTKLRLDSRLYANKIKLDGKLNEYEA